MSKLARKVTLGLTSVVVVLASGELVLRLFVPPRVYASRPLLQASPNFDLWSSSHFRVDDGGAVSHRPHETVRLVVADLEGIEYDVTYRMNNLGLVDHEDYPFESEPTAGRHVAIVGDSFAAGLHGGTPWIPTLRDRLRARDPATHLYNLGLSGASLLHAEKLLKSVSRHVDFTEILVLAPSAAFGRGFWTPHAREGAIWFVPENARLEATLRERPVARVIAADAPAAELQESVRRWYEGDRRTFERRRGILRRSALFQLGEKTLRTLRGQRMRRSRLVRENLDALARIRAAFPDVPVSFVHVPRKGEIARDAYDLELEEPLERLGIRYFPALHETEWSLELFHRRDGHPNAQGYVRIAEYVERVLGETAR